MNFDFPDELKQLRDEARRFLTERCPTRVPRRILESTEPYDRALWQVDRGDGLDRRGDPGGIRRRRPGPSRRLRARRGTRFRWLPCRSPRRSIWRPRRCCCSAPKRRSRQYLPKLAAGEIIGTFAMAERPGPADPSKLTAHGRPMDGLTAPSSRSRTATSRISRSLPCAASEVRALLSVDLTAPAWHGSRYHDRPHPVACADRVHGCAGRSHCRPRGRRRRAPPARFRRRADGVRAGRRCPGGAGDGE